MEAINMVYNSQLEALTIPEYGRNVQNLVAHCKTIEDKERKQAAADEIVALMSRMNSPSKMTPEFTLKLWKHFLIISNYEIEVNMPEGVSTDPAEEGLSPEKPDYPSYLRKFRHYGHFVQHMVDKAKTMEAGPLQDQFFRIIGSYMKLAYRTWNSTHYVSDEIVKEDLASMTDGTFVMGPEVGLDFHNSINNPHISHTHPAKKRRNNNGKGGGGRNKNNYRQKRRR